MFSYLAYGLNIQSDLAVPELREINSAAADVIIQRGRVNQVPDDSKPVSCSYIDPQTIFLYLKDSGKFLIKNGEQIIIDPRVGVNERLLRHHILGPALALLLYQKGYLVLHASAVSIDGEALAFLGQSGRGKSTTAAAFHAHGYNVVADDELAIRVSESDAPMVFPSFPQLKLWPEVLNSFGEAPDMLPQVHPEFDKRARLLSRGFSHLPLPLKRIYVIADSETLGVALLPPQQAIIELVRHSYGARLIHSVKDSRHLLKCASLVKKVAICRLDRPRSLTKLSEMVRVLERDVANHEI